MSRQPIIRRIIVPEAAQDSPAMRLTRHRAALLDWRAENRLTQPEAAPLLKISPRALQNYEAGPNPVPAFVLAFIKLPIDVLRGL